MLFSISTPTDCLLPVTDNATRGRVLQLLDRFAASFPDIRLDVDWNSNSLNAQAFRLGPQAHVRVYGGLARHRTIGQAGLAVALAHEIGHHKGGAPVTRHYHWMSTDRCADSWAVAVGLPAVFGRSRAPKVAQVGATQLFAAITELLTASVTQQGACTDESPCLGCRAGFFRADVKGLNPCEG